MRCPHSLFDGHGTGTFPESKRSSPKVLRVSSNISDGIGEVARIADQGVTVVALPDAALADFTR